MKNVTKIVLTGGPSGGKTEALKRLGAELSKLGFEVHTVSEAATNVMREGFDRNISAFEFQRNIALRQIQAEKEAEQCREGEHSLVICDRGLMDAAVYLDADDFAKFKDELGLCDTQLRDRYDAVFHLDSTSTDDEKEYSTDKFRSENRDSACEINSRSLKAWCGNPHYRFIPVCESFEQKFELLLAQVKAFLGVPKPLEIERKFLIEYPDTDFLLKQNCVKADIFQTYLVGEEGKYRLRKRGSGGSYIFVKTVKKKISETVREETETRISEQEYEALLNGGLKTGSVSKERYCLMYEGRYFEIDIFPFWKKQAYLEIELLSEDESFEIPPFVNVIREVTFDPRYKNSSLCKSVPDED